MRSPYMFLIFFSNEVQLKLYWTLLVILSELVPVQGDGLLIGKLNGFGSGVGGRGAGYRMGVCCNLKHKLQFPLTTHIKILTMVHMDI